MFVRFILFLSIKHINKILYRNLFKLYNEMYFLLNEWSMFYTMNIFT